MLAKESYGLIETLVLSRNPAWFTDHESCDLMQKSVKNMASLRYMNLTENNLSAYQYSKILGNLHSDLTSPNLEDLGFTKELFSSV